VVGERGPGAMAEQALECRPLVVLRAIALAISLLTR
jgi:hypothetical protein